MIRLTPPNGCTGSVVLDLLEDVLLVVGVSLTTPDRLFIGRLNWSNLSLPIVWQPLSSDDVSVEKPSLASDLLVFNLPDGMDYEVWHFILTIKPKQKIIILHFLTTGESDLSQKSFTEDSVDCLPSRRPAFRFDRPIYPISLFFRPTR